MSKLNFIMKIYTPLKLFLRITYLILQEKINSQILKQIILNPVTLDQKLEKV